MMHEKTGMQAYCVFLQAGKQFAGGAAFVLLMGLCVRPAFAVVGQAERYDEFKEQDLTEFHTNLMMEENNSQKTKPLNTSNPTDTALFPAAQQGQLYDEEVKSIKKELLRLPKRDRFKFGTDDQYTFDSNVLREPPNHSHAESTFDTSAFSLFDLSGRKTDLRLELRGGKQWNIRFPRNDYWTMEERLRYRRKYFKKITSSVQSRFARTSSKTIEIDEKKVRWDSHQNAVFNYEISKKLSANLEFDANKRLFTTEAFDQDSQWQAEVSPGAFWNITPKSRIALAYTFGVSRIRTKSGDSNTHEIHLGYFGKVTRKSSVSFDISFSHQSPRSLDTSAINTYKVGLGYIWQMTPKSQLVIEAIRSLQNTTSDRVGNTDNTVKNDQYFTNDSFNISLNTRLTRKLTGIFTTGISHVRNEAGKNDGQNKTGRQFTFPTVVTFNYDVTRWLQWRLQYTFAYRTGNEKTDTYQSHALMTGVNMNF